MANFQTLSILQLKYKKNMKNEIMFDKNVKFRRTPSRIRTRFIAVFALIISLITFGTSFLTILYMNSTAFENLLEMKNFIRSDKYEE